ncbi:UDP-glucose dehydrogenase family protein [Haliangium ochraceum]|uniref:UDP-glucose 6-dehydrogenase n=1 Tax=Haliangium ochraceum (strain DSM 14365 / JCM 11303 / SMP-2) TaxID=502025 RepID=D0LL54_HALO1|nr:UDP-glucose/GDP-mannose dehydrogenase family protein [Haliangium ochraceum]ACY18550.1 nucleotide sugar dehydrogenase [Haliangium ochraceum DSM 14365]
MKITVIGTGYVGLVVGACFSNSGNRVTCVDVDAERIRGLERNEIPFYEPGLTEIVRRNTTAERLAFTTDAAAAVATAEVVFIAVGTPQSESGAADLSAVFEVARTIGEHAREGAIIVIKSTVPVGTTDRLRKLVAQVAGRPVPVVFNPEFLKEGDAVNDFMRPPRVILGGDDQDALATLVELYEPFVLTNNRIQLVDDRSAELTKYAANCMLATRVSYMNELALLAEKVGADIELVRRGIGADPRIGASFLFAGPGFGGSCFPKDLQALLHTGDEVGQELSIIRAVRDANERQKQVLGARIVEHFGDDLSGRRVAVWGIAFKPETDDLRESPALTLIADLRARGAEVVAFDPAAGERAREHFAAGDIEVEVAGNMYDALRGADALVLVTEWHQFRRPDFDRVGELMRGRVLFDGRNMWHGSALRAQGFTYFGIGREVPGSAVLNTDPPETLSKPQTTPPGG